MLFAANSISGHWLVDLIVFFAVMGLCIKKFVKTHDTEGRAKGIVKEGLLGMLSNVFKKR